MKRYIIILHALVVTVGYSQQASFTSVLQLFTASETPIPDTIALDFFRFVPSESATVLYANSILVYTDEYVLLSTSLGCDKKTKCNQSFVTSFNREGKRLGKIPYERVISDCSFNDSRSVVFVSEDLIVFREEREKLDCLSQGKKIGKKIWLEFQPINQQGVFLKPYTEIKDVIREHVIFSHRVFTIQELEQKTSEELAIIKNEIFAAHGYVFKTEKWRAYFQSKPWYMPSDHGASQLTAIEKENVALILQIKNITH